MTRQMPKLLRRIAMNVGNRIAVSKALDTVQNVSATVSSMTFCFRGQLLLRRTG